MTTPTVKLIDITNDLSAEPIGADHNPQYTALTDRSASLAGRAPSGGHNDPEESRRRTPAADARRIMRAGVECFREYGMKSQGW
jgi:hypothetical protein